VAARRRDGDKVELRNDRSLLITSDVLTYSRLVEHKNLIMMSHE
jgi:hypothetical protein